jgi:hypothetical protein
MGGTMRSVGGTQNVYFLGRRLKSYKLINLVPRLFSLVEERPGLRLVTWHPL